MVVFDHLMPVFAFNMNFVVRNITFKNIYVMKHNILTVSYFFSIYFLLPNQCHVWVCGSSHFICIMNLILVVVYIL